MYKDFKKSESLDTGFVGGSGILWMMSGIILGLVVGLGMYYFSNNNSSGMSLVEGVQKKIEKAQQSKPMQYKQDALAKSRVKRTKPKHVEPRKNNFSYYAVLPTLDVPFDSSRPIDTRDEIILSQKLEKNGALLKVSAKSINAKPEEKQTNSRKFGDYLLQVASFKKKSMANAALKRLENNGIEAYVQKKEVRGRDWYRVVAGPIDQHSIGNWKLAAEKLGHRPLIISLR